MILWTTFYNPQNKERLDELEVAIRLNCDNPNIEKFIILCEKIQPSFSHKKIEIISIQKRPSYDTFFNLYDDKDINILINTDIILDYEDTLKLKNIERNEFFALTRYEIGNRIITNYDDILTKKVSITNYSDHHNDIYSCTSDTWVVFGKPSSTDKTDFFFELGVPSCEVSLLYTLYKNGYKIFNPCLSIFTYHYHKDEDRTYYKKAYDWPRLFTIPSIFQNNKKKLFYLITNKFSVSIFLNISSVEEKPWKKFNHTPLFKILKLLKELTDDMYTTYYISIKSGIGYEDFIDDIDTDIHVNFYYETLAPFKKELKNKYIFFGNDKMNITEKDVIYKSIKKIINCGENTLVKPLDNEFPIIVNSDFYKKIYLQT